MKLSLIVDMSQNGVIGDKGGLPWSKIPEDMANFRKLTMGRPCIMGRKTWDSLPRPLAGRKNVVLGRSIIRGIEGVYVVRTPVEAIVEAFDQHGTDEAFVIGGASIYRLFWPLCDEAHVTTIQSYGDTGDTYFPYVFTQREWDKVEVEQLTPEVRYRKLRRTI